MKYTADVCDAGDCVFQTVHWGGRYDQKKDQWYRSMLTTLPMTADTSLAKRADLA